MDKIIGREAEQIQLTRILQSKDAELAAVYGRRRVGKTFLIRNFFEKQLLFELSGIHNASLDQQLENFNIETASAEEIFFQREKFESLWNKYHLVRTVASILSFALNILSIFQVKRNL